MVFGRNIVASVHQVAQPISEGASREATKWLHAWHARLAFIPLHDSSRILNKTLASLKRILPASFQSLSLACGTRHLVRLVILLASLLITFFAWSPKCFSLPAAASSLPLGSTRNVWFLSTQVCRQTSLCRGSRKASRKVFAQTFSFPRASRRQECATSKVLPSIITSSGAEVRQGLALRPTSWSSRVKEAQTVISCPLE